MPNIGNYSDVERDIENLFGVQFIKFKNLIEIELHWRYGIGAYQMDGSIVSFVQMAQFLVKQLAFATGGSRYCTTIFKIFTVLRALNNTLFILERSEIILAIKII